ncbi:MAG: hypothetical protein Tsb0020_21220 [Haliangiales bacterium]
MRMARPQNLTSAGPVVRDAQRISAGAAEPQALEVVTMLGDSVMGVTHLRAPRDRNARRDAYILFGLAALGFVAAAVVFGHGLAVAAANKQALAHWVGELGQPVHEFRPVGLGVIYDVIALLGLLGGFVALVAGALRWRQPQTRQQFRLGSDVDADAHVAALAGSSEVERDAGFVLAALTGGASAVDGRADDMAGRARAVVRVLPGMDVHVRAGAQGGGAAGAGDTVHGIDACVERGLAKPDSERAGAHCIEVTPHSLVRVELGTLGFVIRMAVADRTRRLWGVRLPERRALRFGFASAAAHIALIVFLSAIPPAPETLGLSLGIDSQRTISVRSKTYEESIVETSDNKQHGPGATAMTLPAQSRGPESPTAASGGAPKRVDSAPGSGTRESERLSATRSGMLAFLGDRPGVFDPLASIGDFDAPDGVVDAYGMPTGWTPGSTWGGFGNGPGGFGPGDTPGGTIASSGYNTIGMPGGDGLPGPGGTGRPGFDPRRPHGPPVVNIKPAKVSDGLDRAIVRRYIKRKHARIRHCYERALMRAPDLAGTVVARFMISPDGSVMSSRAEGMSDAPLEGCVAEVISSIQFPRTTGDALVSVSYPFELRALGQ